jgi:hypothetical protein
MTRFVFNPGFQRQIEAEALHKAAMHELAEKVAENVRQIAPRHTGAYADSIVVKGSIVATTDFAGHLIEWGGGKTPVYAPLRRGVKAAGLRLRESPRP